LEEGKKLLVFPSQSRILTELLGDSRDGESFFLATPFWS
jgi:hypothetical protein